MHKLCRWLLGVATIEFFIAGALFFCLFWPWTLYWLVALAFLKLISKRPSHWLCGTARWATESELRREGMIGAQKGLCVGRFVAKGGPTFASSIFPVLHGRGDDRQACEHYLHWWFYGLKRASQPKVRLANAVHTAVIAPTGIGKNASFIVPHLQELDESAVVLDFKGENAKLTARVRHDELGHHCVFLDPFRVVTQHPDRLNPLDFICNASPVLIDECRDLAEQLVVKTAEEREPHWNDSAELFITAAILATALRAQLEDRSLQGVRNILSHPDGIPELIKLLSECGEMPARIAGQLSHYRDKELSSTLTTANRHLRFLDTPAIWESTSESSFNPGALRRGKMTVYCILPPEHMRAQSSLIRLWIGTLLRSVIRGGLQNG